MLIPMKAHDDERGSLTVLEPLPFEPKRIFTVTAGREQRWRGGHALRSCHLLMVCMWGLVMVDLKPQGTRYDLQPNSTGLLIKPMTWVDYCFCKEGSSIMILASELFDAGAYIDDYSEFLRSV